MEQESEISKFRKSLPIYQYKERIIDTVRKHNFAIITGDTGSGKSTQLPQYLIDSHEITDELKSHMPEVSEYRQGKVKPFDQIKLVITQPRRMAAVSMAMRLCYERGQELGQQIGYTIRFDDKTSSATRLKYVTDGIFVRECITDPYLFRYQVVILDEAHERSLYTDILFALIKKAVEYRKGTLKLIITSATLNTKTFSNYYGNCPVLPMHGKLFPVEVKYFPIHHNQRIEQAVKAAIRMHLHQGPGDILVFLTGSEECEIATRVCYERLEELMQKGRDVPGMIIYSLYGALSNEDQAKVFEKTPVGIRKVVFSTNIAETSLTIDNIGFVIDCGFVKQKTYNPKTNMDTLVTIPISKVQAIQRKGRAGRTQQGKCLRLYTEKFYEEMKDFATPEILRVSLTNVILTLKSMRIDDVINFEYMENPDKQTIFKALGELFLLHALNQNGQITDLGIQMCKFPLEPPYSKALITSLLFGVEQRMITLVSLLSTESIWKKVLRINEQEYGQFMEKLKQFNHPTGDHETMLTAYRKWTENDMSNEYCEQNFLNFRAMRQAQNIKNQLYEIIHMCNIDLCRRFYRKDHNYIEYKELLEKDKKLPPEYIRTLLRRSLATGFYFNSAKIMNNAENYLLMYPEGTVVALDPTCALAIQELYPKYVVFTELGSGFGLPIMRTISAVDGDWVLPYMNRTKDIDIFRLAGIKFQPKKEIAVKPEQDEETKKRRRDEQLQKKLRQARQRYQVRKKQKKI